MPALRSAMSRALVAAWAAVALTAACSGTGGAAGPAQTAAHSEELTAQAGGVVRTDDGAFSVLFGPGALSADGRVTISTHEAVANAAGPVYHVSLASGLTFTEARITLAPPGSGGPWALGWSPDAASAPFMAIGEADAAGFLTAKVSQLGWFASMPAAGAGAGCSCDVTPGACDAGCEGCDADCGASPGPCEEQLYPGKGTPIEAAVCAWSGVAEPGVADLGTYDFLCHEGSESLHELAGQFPGEVDLGCLAASVGRGLASFVLADLDVPYGVAYLWVDGDFVSRLMPWDGGIALAACGLPHPQTRNMALEQGWHDWKVEAFATEHCTLYNQQSDLTCGAGFDPEASLAARWEGSVHVGLGACARVQVTETDRTATGAGGSPGCEVSSLTIKTEEAALAAQATCTVNGNVIIAMGGAGEVDLRALKKITGDLWIAGVSRVQLAKDLVLEGDLRVHGFEKVDFDVTIEGLTHVLGDVELSHDNATGVTFTDLAVVDGLFDAHGEGVRTLRMPALVEVKGTDQVSALLLTGMPLLETFEAPALKTLGASLRIKGLGPAAEPVFPALESVGRFLVVERNEGMAVARFPALQDVGLGLRVEYNEGLVELLLPALRTIGHDGPNSVYVGDEAALTKVYLPALEAITGDIALSNLGAATAASFPELTSTGGLIAIDHAPSMTELDLSALGSLGALEVEYTGLDQCMLDELAQKLGTSCDCTKNAGSCN